MGVTTLHVHVGGREGTGGFPLWGPGFEPGPALLGKLVLGSWWSRVAASSLNGQNRSGSPNPDPSALAKPSLSCPQGCPLIYPRHSQGTVGLQYPRVILTPTPTPPLLEALENQRWLILSPTLSTGPKSAQSRDQVRAAQPRSKLSGHPIPRAGPGWAPPPLTPASSQNDLRCSWMPDLTSGSLVFAAEQTRKWSASPSMCVGRAWGEAPAASLPGQHRGSGTFPPTTILSSVQVAKMSSRELYLKGSVIPWHLLALTLPSGLRGARCPLVALALSRVCVLPGHFPGSWERHRYTNEEQQDSGLSVLTE
ncbi:uncharacterized protein LOC134472880 [Cavia porcellus]|uniref:uncharacterized protein LOC134472880 n=1 Tax=Cavia porcellus TaxID=10141 RepID=UPI002FE17846